MEEEKLVYEKAKLFICKKCKNGYETDRGDGICDCGGELDNPIEVWVCWDNPELEYFFSMEQMKKYYGDEFDDNYIIKQE